MTVQAKRLLKCEEWGKLQVGDGLELSTYDELGSILAAWRSKTGEAADGYFDVLPNAIVPKFWSGTLETKQLILEVSPIGSSRIDDNLRGRLDVNLSAMLASAMSSQSVMAGQALLSSDGGRYEALLEVFCDDLHLARRRQVIRRYVSEVDTLPSPRGRISFPSQCYESIRRPGQFASEWVSLTEDVPEYRIFKEVLLRYRPRCSARIRGRIDLCLSELDAVDATGDHRLEWAKVRADRLPQIYHSLLKQSRILLDEEGVGVFAGDRLAAAEIVFTSRLFEQFVAKEFAWLAPSEGLYAKAQNRGFFACQTDDGKGFFELIPDVRLTNKKGQTKLIVDTKWKFLEMGKRNFGISRNDIYQILVYASRFNCSNVVLLYPDVTADTGEVGFFKTFSANFEHNEIYVHIAKIPLLANSLLPTRNFLGQLMLKLVGADAEIILKSQALEPMLN